jgi:hypothetical protein
VTSGTWSAIVLSPCLSRSAIGAGRIFSRSASFLVLAPDFLLLNLDVPDHLVEGPREPAELVPRFDWDPVSEVSFRDFGRPGVQATEWQANASCDCDRDQSRQQCQCGEHQDDQNERFMHDLVGVCQCFGGALVGMVLERLEFGPHSIDVVRVLAPDHRMRGLKVARSAQVEHLLPNRRPLADGVLERLDLRGVAEVVILHRLERLQDAALVLLHEGRMLAEVVDVLAMRHVLHFGLDLEGVDIDLIEGIGHRIRMIEQKTRLIAQVRQLMKGDAADKNHEEDERGEGSSQPPADVHFPKPEPERPHSDCPKAFP